MRRRTQRLVALFYHFVRLSPTRGKDSGESHGRLPPVHGIQSYPATTTAILGVKRGYCLNPRGTRLSGFHHSSRGRFMQYDFVSKYDSSREHVNGVRLTELNYDTLVLEL